MQSLATDKLVAGNALIGSALIGDGEITNAKIGDVIQSTNYSEANGTGWMIDKNGNAKFFNITALGNIQASSIGANCPVPMARITDLMVDTIHIAGQAVTTPLGFDQAVSPTTITTPNTDFEIVAGTITVENSSPDLPIPILIISHVDAISARDGSSNGLITVTLKRTTNGASTILKSVGSYRTDQFVMGSFDMYIYINPATLLDTDIPGNGVHTYSLSIRYSGIFSSVTYRNGSIQLVALRR
jgi:hypothetical protein